MSNISLVLLASTEYSYKNGDVPFYKDKEFQIRTFGWMLLGGWLGMIIYMTRDFLFPSISKIVRNEDLETKKDEVKNREEGLRKLSHCFTPVKSGRDKFLDKKR